MSFKYSRYIGRVVKQPWAILPEKFMIIAELFQARMAGTKFSDEEIAQRLGGEIVGARAGGGGPRPDGLVAVIPVHGTVANRADSFEASSGGTSTELIGRALARVVGDDSIKAIVLDFDTPGGSVEGVPELGAAIARAAAVKPVIAHVNALAASAGYWLASQCSEIVCTPSGAVGSIGVFMLSVDESEALAQAGIKINAISAGDFKLEGASWNPLSADSRAFFQAQVDTCYKDFLAAVAKGRGVSVADVKKNFGQGRCYDAKEALGLGMIDRIATLDDTLARVVGSRGMGTTRALAATAAPDAEPVLPVAAAPAAVPELSADDEAALLAAMTED